MASVVSPVIPCLNQSLETILPNGIMTYGKAEVSAYYSEIVNRYPDLWADKGRVAKIPEADWMTIPLVDGWDPTKVAAKVYSTREKDRVEIDKAFDKLHDQGRMEFSNDPTPFAYPVFVVEYDDIPENKPETPQKPSRSYRALFPPALLVSKPPPLANL